MGFDKLKKTNSIRDNVLSLVSVQIINYIFPLASFSITARALGVDGLGQFAFAQAVIVYLQLLTDFGFNLTATRQISIYRDNKEKVNEIYTTTTLAKLILSIFGMIAIILASYLFDEIANVRSLLIILSLGVVSSVFYPVWLFQGLEKMRNILISNLISKSIILFLLFLLVHNPEDIFFSAFAQSMAWVSVALFSLFRIYKTGLVKFIPVKIGSIIATINDAKYIFFSAMSTSFYSNFNLVMLGFFTNHQLVAYYSVADKIRSMAQTFISAIAQSYYPRFCFFFSKENNNPNLLDRNKIIRLFLFLGVSISLGMFLLSSYMVEFVAGKGFIPAVNLVKIFSILIPVIAMAYFWGTLSIAASGNQKVFFKIYFIGAIIHLLYVYPFIKYGSHLGLAISVLITESIITYMLWDYKKKLSL